MAGEKKITVTQIRSEIGREPKTRKTLRALGLGRIGKTREYVSNPALLGLIKRVEHLLEVSEAK